MILFAGKKQTCAARLLGAPALGLYRPSVLLIIPVALAHSCVHCLQVRRHHSVRPFLGSKGAGPCAGMHSFHPDISLHRAAFSQAVRSGAGKSSLWQGTAMAAFVLCGAIIVWNQGFPGRIPSPILRIAEGEKQGHYYTQCSRELSPQNDMKNCLLGSNDPTRITTVLWGDSHAAALAPAVDAAAFALDATAILLSRHSCPPPDGSVR